MAEISQYTPRVMLDALKQMPPVPSFLARIFTRREIEHDTRNVEIDIEKGGQKMAAYVSRTAPEGNVVAKRGFSTNIHAIPYLYEEIAFTPEDLQTRLPGNTIYAAGGPAQRLNQRLADWLEELMGRVARRKEYQAAQALQTGKVVVSGKGVDYTVDFLMPAANIYTVGTLWTENTADILGDIAAAAMKIQLLGAPTPNVMVCGVDAIALMLGDESVRAALDNRRYNVGEVNPTQLSDERATWIGRLNLPGVSLELYSYHATYQDDAGDAQYFMDPKKFIMGSTAARVEMHYGMIENFHLGSFVGKEFPHMYIEPNGKVGKLTLESGPLFGLHQSDAFVCVTVKA